MSYLATCIPGGSADRRPGWIITFLFDAETIQALKAAVPYWDDYGVAREWRGDEREWWVSRDYEDKLGKLFPNFEAFRTAPRML